MALSSTNIVMQISLEQRSAVLKGCVGAPYATYQAARQSAKNVGATNLVARFPAKGRWITALKRTNGTLFQPLPDKHHKVHSCFKTVGATDLRCRRSVSTRPTRPTRPIMSPEESAKCSDFAATSRPRKPSPSSDLGGYPPSCIHTVSILLPKKGAKSGHLPSLGGGQLLIGVRCISFCQNIEMRPAPMAAPVAFCRALG